MDVYEFVKQLKKRAVPYFKDILGTGCLIDIKFQLCKVNKFQRPAVQQHNAQLY